MYQVQKWGKDIPQGRACTKVKKGEPQSSGLWTVYLFWNDLEQRRKNAEGERQTGL